MLDRYFEDPATVGHLRGHPLGVHLDTFAARLADSGYAGATARPQLWLLARLGHWLSRRDFGVGDLDERRIDAFLARRRRSRRYDAYQRLALGRFLDHLRAAGVTRPAEPSGNLSPGARLQIRYATYLKAERALHESTVENHLPFVRDFLAHRFGKTPGRLRDLVPSDVSDFMLHHTRSMGLGRAKLMVTALRSFLRFLLQHGEIDADLAAAVPSVAAWRLSTVPKYLSSEEVERLIGSCDQSTRRGRRDYAILLLLARLGLRAGEIVGLKLGDICWRSAEILVRGKGQVDDRLPLVPEVGKAIATYLRRDRPRSPSRQVFLRIRAPHRGFEGSSTVSVLVRQAVERADLHPPMKGAHLLRHSLATGLLRRGASLTEIGELLRHRAVSSTEIYAKVDIEGLRALALPWPGAGGGR